MGSISEENYLKAIFKLSQSGLAVSTNALSADLEARPGSITEMIKKLSDKGLITYVRYKGVELTEQGRHIALQVIRKHRIWETFLVEKLGFSWDQVHEIAEQLEHIESERLIHALDEFLGFPAVDPHGDPIPSASGELAPVSQQSLSNCQPGERVSMSGVSNHSAEFLQLLDELGFSLGCQIEVLQRIAFDGSVQVAIEARPPVFVSRQVGEHVLVG